MLNHKDLNRTFDNKTFSELLSEKGISQTGLARMTGVKQSNISRYVAGKYKPAFETAEIFANALKVPVGALYVEKLVPGESLCEKPRISFCYYCGYDFGRTSNEIPRYCSNCGSALTLFKRLKERKCQRNTGFGTDERVWA